MAAETALRFSNNISVVKLFAITGIIFGHYWNLHPVPLPLMGHWWVTSAIGLLIFSITSGYFTAAKYADNFDFRSFWNKKIYRLGIPLTIINCFLLVLFVLQGREDILSVQTAASWLGIHGIWSWLGIPQVGPYGAGLWFLTALLLFYGIYPLLSCINRKRWISWIFTLAIVVVLLLLDHSLPLGYTLWLTLAGFFVGIWIARNSIGGSRSFWATVLAVSLTAMVVFKFIFHIKAFGSLFMLIEAVALVQLCNFIVLPAQLYRLLLPLSSIVLSMYIVHMYLFVSFTGLFFLDWLMSFSLILAVSCLADRLARIVEEKMKTLSWQAAKTI